MNKFLTKLIVASILLPGIALAEDFASYVHRMIQNAKDGGGTVIIENHSSASTGGQVAGAGQTVTDGDVSASSHVETRINAGNDGGTVYVKTETMKNGETQKEEYTKTVKPGTPVEVNVSAKVTPDSAEMETEIQGETMDSLTDAGSDDEEIAIIARVETAFRAVPTFFKKILGFFWGW